ncbi:Uncharacterized protein TCM_002949 [Theobroma cacao]|uniref:Uncharacterized protein n=1 Tax=Theobroma cacao TaxID=3641 RepID=A0A061DPC1_THECC|nr:Uncharacterized protein TCM_002949 [Theobroma cacao]
MVVKRACPTPPVQQERVPYWSGLVILCSLIIKLALFHPQRSPSLSLSRSSVAPFAALVQNCYSTSSCSAIFSFLKANLVMTQTRGSVTDA